MTTGAFDPEERRLFADSVDRYAADRFEINSYRDALAAGACDAEAWSAIADLGWTALPIPVEQGGMAAGVSELGIVMRGIGRSLMLEPYLATVVLAGGLIDAAGTPEQRSRWLEAIATGGLRAAFAHQEPGMGFADGPLETHANGGVLSGHKCAVLHGDVADLLVVSAREEAGATGLYLVMPEVAGLTVRRYPLIDGRGAIDIDLQDVPAERLGTEDAGCAITRVRLRATAAVCAEAVGAMSALNAVTLEYVKTRRQFGRTIGSFQVLQHRLVDMAIAEQEANALANAAASALDAGSFDAPRYVAAAKIRAGRAARFIGEASIQTHGGIGMMDEYVAGHLFKRLLMLGAFLGDADWHLDRLAECDPS